MIPRLEFAHASIPLIPPGCSNPVEEFCCYTSVDLIEIESIEPVLEAICFTAQLRNRLISLPLPISATFANCLANQLKGLVIYLQIAANFSSNISSRT